MDVAIRPGGDTWSTDYDERGMSELVPCLRTVEPTAVLLEATGGLEVPLVSALAAAALPVVVVNPRQVRDFAKATGKLAKTDALDAQVLAHFAEAVRPPVRPLRDEDTQELNLYVVFDLQMCQFVGWVRGARRGSTGEPGNCPGLHRREYDTLPAALVAPNGYKGTRPASAS